MKSVHEAKAKHQTIKAYAVPELDQRPATSGTEVHAVKKRKHDEQFEDSDNEVGVNHKQSATSSSSRQPLSRDTNDDEDDVLLDKDAINQMMKKSKRDSSLQQKSQEFLQVRDELLRSRRAVHVLTGSEAVTVCSSVVVAFDCC